MSDLDDEITALSHRKTEIVEAEYVPDKHLAKRDAEDTKGINHGDDQESEFFSLASQPPPLDKYEKYTSHVLLHSEAIDDHSIGTLTASVASTVGGDMSTITSVTKANREPKGGISRTPVRQPLVTTQSKHQIQLVPDNHVASQSEENKTFSVVDRQDVSPTDENPYHPLIHIQKRASLRGIKGLVGFDVQEEDSTVHSSSTSNNLRNLQAKFKDLNFFSRTFDYCQYKQLKEASLKENIDSIVVQSKEDYKLAKQEAMLLSKNPLNEFVKDLTSICNNNESKSFMVRQAAAMRAEQRSAMSTRVIMEFLQSQCKMANYLTYCSIYDLEVIANAVQLIDISPPFDKMKLHYALGIEFGDTIANIYILLSGNIVIDRLDTLLLDLDDEVFQEMDVNSQWKYIYNHPHLYENKNVFSREELGMGDVLGENVLNGEYGWTFHLRSLIVSGAGGTGHVAIEHGAAPEAVSLLRIPVSVIQRSIGRKGSDVEEGMVYFWKMTRLWNEIVNYNKCFMQTTLFHSLQQNNPNGETRQKLGPVQGSGSFQPMNSIESARLRTYQAGAEIFSQGQPRVYLFIIKQGSATYYRDFPKDRVGLDIMPERVETVQQCAHALPKLVPVNKTFQHVAYGDTQNLDSRSIFRIEDGEESDGGMLLSNDFSFMDSEDASIISRIEAQDEKFLEEIGIANNGEKESSQQTILNNNTERNEQIFEYRKRRYHRFLTHQNTLIATTRCEILVVPISEIAKCLPLFRKLIQLANLKYPMILVDNEEVIRQYYHRKQWEDNDKTNILEKVSKEKVSKRLFQEDLHFLACYESDSRYKRSPKQMLLSTTYENQASPVANATPNVLNLSFCTSFNSPSRCRSPKPTAARGHVAYPSPLANNQVDKLPRPKSAYESPRSKVSTMAVITPFTPNTPKSSSVSPRPPISARLNTGRTLRNKLDELASVLNPDSPVHSKSVQEESPSDIIKLEYLNRYKTILADTVGKFEAENAEIMKILNSKPSDENNKKSISGDARILQHPNPPAGDGSKRSQRHQALIGRLSRPTSASVARSVRHSAKITTNEHSVSDDKRNEGKGEEPLRLEVPAGIQSSGNQLMINSAPVTMQSTPHDITTSPIPSTRRRAIQVNVHNVYDLELGSSGYRQSNQQDQNSSTKGDRDDINQNDYLQYNFYLRDPNNVLSTKKQQKLQDAEKEKREMQKVLFSHLLFHHQNNEDNIIATTTLTGEGSPKRGQRSPPRLILSPDQYAKVSNAHYYFLFYSTMYHQLYRERVTENPKQRFIDEFVRKSHL